VILARLTAGKLVTEDGWVDQQVDLSAYAGQTIQLAWRHYESSEYFKFDDVLVYYKTADGINTLDNNSANGTSEIFNANGVKMQTLTKGINIVRTTAADGTVKTRKIVVK
jgi:bacillopeptidase F (M6 metalloprotease family)